MHILNFLIAIFLPFISPLALLRPEGSLPAYFVSPQATFIAGELYVVLLYWAGLGRGLVQNGNLNERGYFGIAIMLLLFLCFSKIILALPSTWIVSIFAFGLGVLSANAGQSFGIKSIIVLAVLSLIIVGYATFILIGLAWFDFDPTDYYYYQILIKDWLASKV